MLRYFLSNYVKYVIPGQSGYRVSIAPNPDNDFSFTVDDTPTDWRELGDVTYGFVIERAVLPTPIGRSAIIKIIAVMKSKDIRYFKLCNAITVLSPLLIGESSAT